MNSHQVFIPEKWIPQELGRTYSSAIEYAKRVGTVVIRKTVADSTLENTLLGTETYFKKLAAHERSPRSQPPQSAQSVYRATDRVATLFSSSQDGAPVPARLAESLRMHDFTGVSPDAPDVILPEADVFTARVVLAGQFALKGADKMGNAIHHDLVRGDVVLFPNDDGLTLSNNAWEWSNETRYGLPAVVHSLRTEVTPEV
jgi:hypothetical protein